MRRQLILCPSPGACAPILVVGLLRSRPEEQLWLNQILDRVEPQLEGLIEQDDLGIRGPQFLRVRRQRFRLARVLPGRERILLISAAHPGTRCRQIMHWHYGPSDRTAPLLPGTPPSIPNSSRLGLVHQVLPARRMRRVPLLPFFLEQEIPEGGLDFIRLPGAAVMHDEVAAARIQRGPDPVPQNDAQLAVLTAGLLNLLWETVREVASATAAPRRARAA